MGADSKIEWTHHTFNPWWGCVEVGPECDHCYAHAFAKRVGQDVWGVDAPRRFFGDKHWSGPLKWNLKAEAAGERRRVFCASMADVFEVLPGAAGDRLDVERVKLWALIDATPHLDWLLLTKRPGNIHRVVPGPWADWGMPANVWLGTTAGTQKTADNAVPKLIAAPPAVVKFVSVEPLLEPVSLRRYLGAAAAIGAPGVNWIIVGGESGGGSRPCDVQAIRDLVNQCEFADVPCLVKQVGRRPMVKRSWTSRPWGELVKIRTSTKQGIELRTKDPKGGDWDEWPGDLRVREYPEPRAWARAR